MGSRRGTPVRYPPLRLLPLVVLGAGEPAEQQRQLLPGGAGVPDHATGEGCFVSELAAVQTESLELGPSSYIAAHGYVSGTVRTGRN